MTDSEIPPVEPGSIHQRAEPAAARLPAGQSATAAPGWYADGTGEGMQRWWDGTRWTDHVFDTRSSTYTPQPAQLGADTSPYNPFIWVVVLLPIISFVALLSWDMTGYLRAATAHSTGRIGGVGALPATLGFGYLAVTLLSWLAYAALVVFSYLDYRRLGRQGFPRRFHWAWSFLSAIVYVIGRSVVVRSQIGRGLVILWVFVGIQVLGLILFLIKFGFAFAAVLPSMSGTSLR